jgi:hypothetical protein
MSVVEDLLLWLKMRPKFFGEAVPKEAEALKEKYKRGIAEALGISPEDINEEVVNRWILHWMRAMIKPEAWSKYGLI